MLVAKAPSGDRTQRGNIETVHNLRQGWDCKHQERQALYQHEAPDIPNDPRLDATLQFVHLDGRFEGACSGNSPRPSTVRPLRALPVRLTTRRAGILRSVHRQQKTAEPNLEVELRQLRNLQDVLSGSTSWASCCVIANMAQPRIFRSEHARVSKLVRVCGGQRTCWPRGMETVVLEE